jgi:hypothetical protein
MNTLHEFLTSSLEVNLSKTNIMIFDRNKRKSNQEAFYLDKDQIEITHEYKYLRIEFYSHGYFEPSSKRRRIIGQQPSERHHGVFLIGKPMTTQPH